MNSSPEDANLPLAAWKLQPSCPPDFRSQVWARIEAAKNTSSWPRYVRAHPAAIAGGLTVAIVVGAVGGWERAQAQMAVERSQIAASYVQSMDARLMKMP